MRFEVSGGARVRPQRLLLYGPEGIGKSTLASQMPDPVFIDTEDGTDHLEVMRIERPTSWDMLLNEVAFLSENPCGASTVVLDTADAAERLCQQKVCDTYKKGRIEDFGYGKGYTYARDEFSELLDSLDRCIARGLNVVLVAHSTMRKFERPDESGAYDRFELKLDKRVSALVKEWADAVLFVDWETFVSLDDSGKAKASGGRRIIRTDHSPVWDAKNRWGLPSTLALDADGVSAIRSHLTVAERGDSNANPTAPVPSPSEMQGDAEALSAERSRRDSMGERFSGIMRLMAESGVSVAEVESAMVSRGKRPSDTCMEDWEQPFVDWVCQQWQAVTSIIRDQREAREAARTEDAPF